MSGADVRFQDDPVRHYGERELRGAIYELRYVGTEIAKVAERIRRIADELEDPDTELRLAAAMIWHEAEDNE
jgi:hypothetical protein